jgi:activating signal cointegrator complex subunit 1
MTLSENPSAIDQLDNDASLAVNASAENALTLLRSLRGRIMGILSKSRAPLKIKLDTIDIMPPERRDLKRAHVMFAGPNRRSEGADVLNAVCSKLDPGTIRHLFGVYMKPLNLLDLVHQEFKKAGLVTETRPLKASERSIYDSGINYS